jgi:hypothetical protein
MLSHLISLPERQRFQKQVAKQTYIGSQSAEIRLLMGRKGFTRALIASLPTPRLDYFTPTSLLHTPSLDGSLIGGRLSENSEGKWSGKPANFYRGTSGWVVGDVGQFIGPWTLNADMQKKHGSASIEDGPPVLTSGFYAYRLTYTDEDGEPHAEVGWFQEGDRTVVQTPPTASTLSEESPTGDRSYYCL